MFLSHATAYVVALMRLKDTFSRYGGVALAVVVGAVHIAILHTVTHPAVRNNPVNVIIEPLRQVIVHGALPWNAQINYYTGTPFFLIPVFSIASSPIVLRAVLIGCMGVATAFAYLAYREAHGTRGGVIGVLVLFNMTTWLVFRLADYTFAAAFTAILLFLHAAWRRRGDDRIIYGAAAVAGFLFYFKASVLYVAAALVVAELAASRGRILARLGPRGIAVTAAAAIAGATPFWLHMIQGSPLWILSRAFSGNEHYNVGMSAVDVVAERLGAASALIAPGATPWTVDVVNRIRPSWMLLLIAAGSLLAVRRRTARYPVAAATLFLLHFHVPHAYRWQQLIVFLPLVPLLVLPLRSALPGSPRRRDAAVMGVLTLSLFLSAPVLATVAGDQPRLTHWGGDPTAARRYARMPRADQVVTNSYRYWVLTRYDFSVKESTLLMPPRSKQLTPTQHEAWNDLLRNNVAQLHGDGVPRDGRLFVLQESHSCHGNVSSCGYNASTVAAAFRTPAERMWTARFDGHTYRVYPP